jgi:hypothetical protein
MANALYLGNAGMMGTPNAKPVPAGPNPVKPGIEAPQIPANQVGPQATRASGPSAGYDPSYLQNLASFIGSLFAGPSSGNTTSFNPLGNLNEVSPPGGQIGNAAGAGAPMTWLQQALSGGGFGFTPTPAPATAGSGVGFGGGVGGGGGFPRGPRQLTL